LVLLIEVSSQYLAKMPHKTDKNKTHLDYGKNKTLLVLSIFLLRTGIFAAIMGYAKERGKLEQLATKIKSVNTYDEKSLKILVDGHEKYSHTVRILKNKEPETFETLYKVELQEVKNGRNAIKESETDELKQTNFLVYKEAIMAAIDKTIEATLNSL
jgi:hypothetical protein